MTVGEFQTLYKYYLELLIWFKLDDYQPAFTFSKLIIETLEQGVKYFQS